MSDKEHITVICIQCGNQTAVTRAEWRAYGRDARCRCGGEVGVIRRPSEAQFWPR